jgi:hypothetical protein
MPKGSIKIVSVRQTRTLDHFSATTVDMNSCTVTFVVIKDDRFYINLSRLTVEDPSNTMVTVNPCLINVQEEIARHPGSL